MNMDFKFLNAGTTGARIQTFMALEIEQIEVGLINQVIQMRIRLNHLQN
jgi:methylglyoxal synthase